MSVRIVRDLGGAALAAFAAARQTANRGATADWQLYAGHRARLHAAIAAVTPAATCANLVVLGAGNANDLDLEALAARWQRIHLVDLDGEALARAMARQPPDVRARLAAHAPIELSGYLPLDPGVGPGSALIAAMPARAAALVASLPGPAEVVVSDCVLSQLLRSTWEQAGRRESPMLTDLRRAIATVHLRAMAAILTPGGCGLLVTDVASGQLYPFDAWPEGGDMRELLVRVTRAGALFPGTAPHQLRRIVREDPQLAGVVDETSVLEPWFWNLSGERLYLVSGVVFQRKT